MNVNVLEFERLCALARLLRFFFIDLERRDGRVPEVRSDSPEEYSIATTRFQDGSWLVSCDPAHEKVGKIVGRIVATAQFLV